MSAPFSALELYQCAAREVKQRRRVYPRLFAQGKMKMDFADRQIAMMAQIAEEYARKVQNDGLFGPNDLFGSPSSEDAA